MTMERGAKGSGKGSSPSMTTFSFKLYNSFSENIYWWPCFTTRIIALINLIYKGIDSPLKLILITPIFVDYAVPFIFRAIKAMFDITATLSLQTSFLEYNRLMGIKIFSFEYSFFVFHNYYFEGSF